MIKEEVIEIAYKKALAYAEKFCNELKESGFNSHTADMMYSGMRHSLVMFNSDIYHESTMDFIKNSILWGDEEKQQLTE
ncbi:MAG TPA: hypothetical protein VN192_02870 [Flavobacterium sp.]|nr:hypothetical protein [Flavobacterium sp.]